MSQLDKFKINSNFLQSKVEQQLPPADRSSVTMAYLKRLNRKTQRIALRKRKILGQEQSQQGSGFDQQKLSNKFDVDSKRAGFAGVPFLGNADKSALLRDRGFFDLKKDFSTTN